MLYEYLKCFAHSFGVQECLKGQASAYLFSFGALREGGGERGGIAPGEGKEEIGLGGKAGATEAGALTVDIECREIDVGGEVLLAGRSVEVFRDAMISVGEHGAAHVILVVQFASFAAVIDGEDEAAFEAAAGALNPAAGGQAYFGALVFV